MRVVPAEELAALAAGLCQDAGIGLELQPSGWAWDPVRRVILVSERDLLNDGPEVCAGILAHEVGHFYISRYTQFALDFPSLGALRLLLNGIEDPRVNTWVVTRYPGTSPWLRLANDQTVAEGDKQGRVQPEFLTFCIECAQEERRHWEPAPASANLPFRVVDALSQTREARRAFAEQTLPDPDLGVAEWGSELTDLYISQCVPQLLGEDAWWLPHPQEQGVRLWVLESLYLANEHILPFARALYDRDVAHIQRFLRNHAAAPHRARQALDTGDLTEVAKIVDAAMQQDATRTDSDPGFRGTARALLDVFVQGAIRPPVIRARPLPPGRRGQRMRLPSLPPLRPDQVLRIEGAYDRARERVAEAIEQLVRELEEALRPRKRLGAASGYPSGFRVDLRKLMVFEADQRRYAELWLRKTIPDRRDATILLLVDLSGSMRGEKAEIALQGTVLLAETLERLGVRFSVYGFQDELIPFVHFGEGLTSSARRAIAEMPLEVAGNRPEGHNQPGYNDDGPCVQEAAELLLAEPGSDRILIAVSDGLPEGRRSTQADLHQVVDRLHGPEVPLHLIGVGLGPGTNHVANFYKDHLAEVPLERFAVELGALIRRLLLVGDDGGRARARA